MLSSAPLADKTFDSNAIIADREDHGARVVTSRRSRRASPRQIDTEICKRRHLIENFLCKLKKFKRIAMRACKTDQSSQTMIHPAAAIINSK